MGANVYLFYTRNGLGIKIEHVGSTFVCVCVNEGRGHVAAFIFSQHQHQSELKGGSVPKFDSKILIT